MVKKFLFFATFLAANTAASTCSATEAETSTRPLEMRLQRERQARLNAARTWNFNRPNPSRSLTGRESLRWMDARPRENPTQDMRLDIGNLQASFKQEKSAPQSAFPASWKWSSDRKKETDFGAPGNSRVAQQWSLGVEAPVEHPFGTARVVANYRENNSGLSTDAKSSIQDDGSAGGVKLIQDVKIGDLTGSADIGLSEAAQKPLSAPTNAVTQWETAQRAPGQRQRQRHVGKQCEVSLATQLESGAHNGASKPSGKRGKAISKWRNFVAIRTIAAAQ